MAAQAGFEPAFERSHRANRPFDVEIRSDSTAMRIETVALLRDARTRSDHEAVDDLFRSIRRIELECSVSFQITFRRQLSPDATRRFVDGLRAEAQEPEPREELTIEGTEVRILTTSSTEGARLRGPTIGGDLWPRMIGVLKRKSEQARASGAEWVRLDALQGLWQFTHWSQLPLAEKLSSLRTRLEALLDATPHLHGVVISSGCLLAQGEFEDESVTDDAGFAIRRNIAPLRVRETIGLATKDVEQARTAIVGLYESEPAWLSWALAEKRLPGTEAIFG